MNHVLKGHGPCQGMTTREETKGFMRKQHCISCKLLTVLLIFLALPITIFLFQLTQRMQGYLDSIGLTGLVSKATTTPAPTAAGGGRTYWVADYETGDLS